MPTKKPRADRRQPKTVWLKPTEYDTLKAEAQDLQLSFSDYGRNLLLERQPQHPRNDVSVETYIELGRIGNNLNQLTRAVNEARHDALTADTLLGLEGLKETLLLLKRELDVIRLEIAE